MLLLLLHQQEPYITKIGNAAPSVFRFFFGAVFFFVGIWLKFLPVGKLGVISEGGARDRCSLFITVILRIDNWLGALGTKEGCKEAGESLAIGNRRRSTHTQTDGQTDGTKSCNGKGSEIDEYLLSRQRKRRNRSDFPTRKPSNSIVLLSTRATLLLQVISMEVR